MTQLKNRLITRNIENGIKRLHGYRKEHGQDTDSTQFKNLKLKCAADQILLREMVAGDKLKIEPKLYRKAIYDEVWSNTERHQVQYIHFANQHQQLFIYIIGGHDTISSTLAWWVKYAGAFPLAQSRLRTALLAAHGPAHASRRLPSAAEIATASIPYLDAWIEETLRYSHIAPAVLRQATVDTTILGCHIPRGTDIFLNTSAASFMTPAFEVAEAKRSEATRQSVDRRAWRAADVSAFVPERWLKTIVGDDEGGKPGGMVEREVFDRQAGPMLAFGVGHRSCFGRKLVYLELKITLTLLIWQFEFLETGERLNSFDAVDSLSQRPRECYVKLRKVEY
jgi:cytochrome P450